MLLYQAKWKKSSIKKGRYYNERDITKDAQRVCLDIRYPERFNQPAFEENYQKLMKKLGLKVGITV